MKVIEVNGIFRMQLTHDEVLFLYRHSGVKSKKRRIQKKVITRQLNKLLLDHLKTNKKEG